MRWEQVWHQALTQYGAESIEVRILLGLAAAFLTLMIIEGLRASFFPAKSKTYPTPQIAAPMKAPVSVMPQPARAPRRRLRLSLPNKKKPVRLQRAKKSAFTPKPRRRNNARNARLSPK